MVNLKENFLWFRLREKSSVALMIRCYIPGCIMVIVNVYKIDYEFSFKIF